MNCIDFRRTAGAGPRGLASEAVVHAAQCAACRALLYRQRELDVRLEEALRVPVPEGLAERVLVARSSGRPRLRPTWAVAAGIVLAAALAWAVPPLFAGHGLAGEALAHVHEEPQSFRIRMNPPTGLLATDLAAQGLRLAADVGEVTYATLCPMATGTARHLVISTPEGPVTLLLLPRDGERRARSQREQEGFTAIAVAAPRGSVAIVAATARQALAVERLLVPA